MAPPMKDPSTRARRNKVTTRATLQADPDIEVPELPDAVGEEDDAGDMPAWHPATRAWWADIWRSPMAPEYDTSDIHGLYMLATLVNDFWRTSSAKTRRETYAEIRLQSQRFGLSPIDRRRLQWEIDRGDEATSRTKRRRERDETPKPAPDPAKDPRQALRLVK